MYDIRTDKPQEIEQIRFADDAEGEGNACVLIRNLSEEHGGMVIADDESDINIEVLNINDARNLMKAIEKAIDLGWFNTTMIRGMEN